MPSRMPGQSRRRSPPNPDADADPAGSAQPFAMRQDHLDERDIERDDGDEQGRKAGWQILLRPDDAGIADAEQEDADGGEHQEVAWGLPKLHSSESTDQQHERPGDEKPHGRKDEGRQHLIAETDSDVGRAPEEVDAGERKKNAGREFGHGLRLWYRLEGRGKREEGRGKRGRGKREEGRGKREEHAFGVRASDPSIPPCSV